MEAASDRDEWPGVRVRQSPDLLDAAAEHELNVIVHHAAAAIGTRMALISLFDDDRRWFTARVGVALSEVPASSLCAHALSDDGVLVVADASRDARFAHDLLVTGEPGIRFYAGAALRLGGARVGTLCVLDDQPRHSLSTLQKNYLIYLADRTVAALATRTCR